MLDGGQGCVVLEYFAFCNGWQLAEGDHVVFGVFQQGVFGLCFYSSMMM